MSDWEERQLLGECQAGNPEALRRLVDAHHQALYRFLWRLTGCPDAADELTQETFVRALERLPTFDGRSRFSTWLHAIALNVWRDAGRRRARDSALAERQASDAIVMPEEREALDRLERHEVRQAVERLPEKQRVAILLFYYQGMSYQEIAQVCRCPVGSVGSWIHHGIRTLRRVLVPAVQEACAPAAEGASCGAQARDAEGPA